MKNERSMLADRLRWMMFAMVGAALMKKKTMNAHKSRIVEMIRTV